MLTKNESRRRFSVVHALMILVVAALLFSALPWAIPSAQAQTSFNYSDALTKSVYFFYFNYSGQLPSGYPVTWRGNSALSDDPPGGYYDAGDHVKFGLPLAFTVAELSWAAYEYWPNHQATGTLAQQIRRGADYIVAADNTSGEFVYQVGDPGPDHAYWGPPEQMTMARPSYRCRNCSAVLGESAAALALAHITGVGNYLAKAQELYTRAETALSDAEYTAANGFYTSFSGFYDELVWAGVWLYIATGNQTYLTKAETYFGNFNADFKWTHSWDDVRYGAILKLAQITGKQVYIDWIERQLDWWSRRAPAPDGTNITYTPAGLPWLDVWGSLRYANAEAFLAFLWADATVGAPAKKSAYETFARNVVNYTLGNNPRGSYVIGFGSNWPTHPHHRAASPNREGPAQFELTGALVGGPDQSDNFRDETQYFQATEVALDYNAALVASLSALAAGGTPPDYVRPTPVPTPTLFPVGNGTGLTGQYYDNQDFTTLRLTRTDATVNFNWAGGSPDPSIAADTYSVRWAGQLQPRVTGQHTFYLNSDDGSRLIINGTQVVNNWSDHAATEVSGTINLTAGQRYDITVEFYESAGDASVVFSWATISQPKQVVPQSQLYPAAGPTPTPGPSNTPTPTQPGPTNTPTPTQPSGSNNTGWVSPSNQAAQTGGDGNGFQTSPTSAFADGGTSIATDTNSGTNTNTSCANTGKDRHAYFNYPLSIPGGSTITGIEVRLDARVDSATGTRQMCVEVSWNNGTTWTAVKTSAALSTTEASYILGSATDTWGRTWSASELTSANFRVRITNVSNSTSRDFFLDWAPVRVTYTGGGGVTNTPTPTLPGPTNTPTATPTPTSGGGGSTCSPVNATIAAPFTQDGSGTFCWQSSNLGAFVNSWNLAELTINGVNFTNQFVSASSYPPQINGFWYVRYVGNFPWSHFEVR
ncbi:MAG TPA: glycoside hydrolase family 9 protein [Anaerolineae bacterium]|nr:glycoside hydrolase family 9 protein [Anaerolineae bacterium]